MATWGCGHARTAQTKLLGKCADSVLEHGVKHGPSLTVRLACADELAARRRQCPACKNAEDRLEADRRKQRRGWFAMALVGAALLLVGVTTCSARAADRCAPYTPADGRTCVHPTILHHIGTAPVCACRAPRIARR